MAKEKETKEKETKDKDPKEKVTKEKAAKPKKGDDKPVKKAVDEDLRHIVRILNTDLAGKKQVHMALTGIKGVGRRCAKLFTDRAGVDPFATLGLLPDAEIDKLKKVIEEDATKILPPWMVNRRGEPAPSIAPLSASPLCTGPSSIAPVTRPVSYQLRLASIWLPTR